MHTGRTLPLKGPALSALKLIWFRDGKQLLLTGYEHDDARPEIWVISAAGAEPRLFWHDANDGASSPDGRSVAFTVDTGQAMRIANVDGRGVRTIARGNADRVFSSLFWPSSGKRISYQQRSPSGNAGTEVELNYEWKYCSLDLRSLLETASVKDVPFDSAVPHRHLYDLAPHQLLDGTQVKPRHDQTARMRMAETVPGVVSDRCLREGLVESLAWHRKGASRPLLACGFEKTKVTHYSSRDSRSLVEIRVLISRDCSAKTSEQNCVPHP